MMTPRRWLGRLLARFLAAPLHSAAQGSTHDRQALAACLRAGDVLLVEGTSRISSAIKYLTQSTWSHAALCFRTPAQAEGDPFAVPVLVEADLNEGVRTVPLSEYVDFHTRICRPVGASAAEIDAVGAYMLARVGHQYDLKNVFDLARYLIRTPPVPSGQRRRLLALGSGDPTRAICSSLIAQAFQSVHYPILPEVRRIDADVPLDADARELLHIRHHSLFAPRDFDISPYFQVVKPTIERGFDFHRLRWSDAADR